MPSKVEFFLSKTLGGDFFESLEKVELWKPGTKTTLDHEEMRTALQIVPRVVIAFLIREISPMAVGDNKKIVLPMSTHAVLNITKHERDVFSGDIEEDNKKITEFKFRSLPGVGLVIMSAFELYDMENLINSPIKNDSEDGVSSKIQKLIDEKIALNDLVEKVVDKKIKERDAVQALMLSRLSEAMSESEMAPVPSSEKGSKHLKTFLEGRKNKISKPEYMVHMAKNETVSCPDCLKDIFSNGVFSSCICFGDSGKVYLKKTENGIKVSFGKNWDHDSIEMLLDVLRKKHE